MKLPSKSQARALRFFVDHGAEGLATTESWSAYNTRAGSELDWHNHQRTLEALRRNGWVSDEDRITDAGLSALIEFVAAEKQPERKS